MNRGATFLALGLAVLFGALPAGARKPRWVSHFYYVNDPSSKESLEANPAKVSLVSPQWFAVDQTGRVASSADAEVIEWARRSRIPLMPLLVNNQFQTAVAHAVLNDDQAQSLLLEQILETARTNRFYGIQLDFENIPAEDRDAFSRFAARLAKEFRRRHLKLSIAVPAPLEPAPAGLPAQALHHMVQGQAGVTPAPSPWKPSAQAAAFDYRTLSNVADSVTVMTYDEYATAGQPGPIAGLPWVEACLEEALAAIPRKKLLLGVPLYFRHWSGKSVAEGSYSEALSLATRWKAKVESDLEQREKKFQFDDGHDSHVVWLEDAESLKERLTLVTRYGLAGFSAWRLGQEDPAAWQTAFSGKE